MHKTASTNPLHGAQHLSDYFAWPQFAHSGAAQRYTTKRCRRRNSVCVCVCVWFVLERLTRALPSSAPVERNQWQESSDSAGTDVLDCLSSACGLLQHSIASAFAL